ncbi:MAG: trans-sulfuration enzyme family protein [Vicinamibacterales bacterium]
MKGPTTTVIHTAERRAPAASLTTPVYETTTFVFETADEVRRYNEGKSDKYLYSRYENPTVKAVEQKIALLEGAEAAMVLSSGMAATATALLALVRAGDEVVCSSAIYGGTFHFLADLLSRFGVTPRFVTLDELSEPARVLGDRTRLLWFESPNNPTLRCVDIRTVTAACRARGVISVIDNTFATPINQRPVDLGVDLVMESATKYLNGHSDVTAGALAGPSALIADCARARRLVGTVLDPYPAYALGRGLKTLALRVERHNANALAIARWLEHDSRVARVYYPGLESHPDHAIAKRQMSGFSGMVCIDLGGGLERASRFYDRLQIVQRAASLGGPESLCSLPVLTSHTGYSDEDLRKAGVTHSMARISIGLEDPEDLIEDLDQALG